MSKHEIEFRDPVVKRVVKKFVDRSNLGFEKYGRTLDAERTGGHKGLFGYFMKMFGNSYLNVPSVFVSAFKSEIFVVSHVYLQCTHIITYYVPTINI